jgi:hypothetical protein
VSTIGSTRYMLSRLGRNFLEGCPAQSSRLLNVRQPFGAETTGRPSEKHYISKLHSQAYCFVRLTKNTSEAVEEEEDEA